jgi:aspartate aminotransferase
MLACLNPGDEVIVPEPMYANYIGFATIADVNVVPITTRIEDGFALPSPEAFAAKVTPRTKAILVNNPGNPTGTVYTDEQLNGLREIALRHDLFLIADEVYREFNFTGRPIRSVLQMPGLERNAVMIDSASKMYSLCGARVGFLVSRNPDVNFAALKFAQARLSPPTLEQLGMIGALDTPQSYLDGVRDEYMRRRDLLVSRLRAIPGVVCPDIHGAFYATVRLPVDDADKFCAWLLTDFDHNGQTVMFAPASGFYETPGLGRDEVRIAYVLNTEDLGRAMDVLEAALAAYPGALVSR